MDESSLVVQLEETCHIFLQTIGTNGKANASSGYCKTGWTLVGVSELLGVWVESRACSLVPMT